MSDITTEMYKNSIKEYLSTINFNGEWSLSKIKQDLKSMLGYEPAVQVKWKKTNMMLEGKEKNIEAVEKITISYFYAGDISTEPQKIEVLI